MDGPEARVHGFAGEHRPAVVRGREVLDGDGMAAPVAIEAGTLVVLKLD